MHEKNIQQLITEKKWDELYNCLKLENIITRSDLNKIYLYERDRMQYMTPDSKLLDRFVTPRGNLFTIAVQCGQTKIVKLLLNNELKLHLKKTEVPLEFLFCSLFRLKSINYYYQHLSVLRIDLIKMILAHAVVNNIYIDLNSPPLEMKILSYKSSSFRDPYPADFQENTDKVSYLQLICGGKNLKPEKEGYIFEIIELLIKAGADIYHKDCHEKTVLDYIIESQVFNKLLEVTNFNFEFINESINKFSSEYRKATEPSDKHLLQFKIKALKGYIVNKFEKGAIRGFIQVITDKNLSEDIVESFSKTLEVKDTYNLKLTCREIYNSSTEYSSTKYITHVEQLEQQKTWRSLIKKKCIVM